MDNIDKLLIITSPFGDEFGKYWELFGKDHPVVKNGNDQYGDDEYQLVFGDVIPDDSWSFLNDKIDDNGYLVMIHFYRGVDIDRFEKRKFTRDGKEIEFCVYYYSTQDLQIQQDLWNIKDDYGYAGPEKDPVCPFDKLRMDIIQGNDTTNSVKDIIDWVKKKIKTADSLETILNLLHQCLTPESAAAVAEINNYEMLENITVEDNQDVDTYIKNNLAGQKDCFSEEYIEKLQVLRDVLLDSNDKIKID